MRISQPSQRVATPARGLSAADHARVTRLAKEMALLAKLQGGASTGPRKAVEAPTLSASARHDYREQLALYGAPKLSPHFLVATPPAAVQAQVDAFETLHGGAAQVALNAIAGERTYQVQVAQRGQAQVLLVDARGHELGRGVARGTSVAWR